MWDSIKKALLGLLGSKKVQTAILTGLSVVAVKYLTVDPVLADQLAQGVFLIGMVLIGAQGLTDIATGTADHPLTVKEAVIKVITGLFGSKKFITAVAGGMVFILVKTLKLNADLAGHVSNGILTLVMVLLGAQGVTDMGKTQQVIENSPTQPTSKS